MFQGPLPARVNHRKLATEKQKLEGSIPLVRFERLVELLLSDKGDAQARLEFRRARKHRSLIIGDIAIKVSLTCQNCLEPMDYDLTAQLRHFIVPDEEALIRLEEDEDGIVVSEDMVDIVDLLEDELILALPMAARHDNVECQVKDSELVESVTIDPAPKDTEAESALETYKPFAGLADLKDEITGATNGRTKK